MRLVLGATLALLGTLAAVRSQSAGPAPRLPVLQYAVCRTQGQYFPDVNSQCRYIYCALSPDGTRLVPEGRACPAGLGVRKNYKGGKRNPCTRSRRKCRGEENTGVDEEDVQMEWRKKMPKQMRLKFRMQKKTKTLRLVRNDNISPDIPLILGKNGTMTRWHKKADYAYYTDVASRAAFAVWEETTNGQKKRKYHGNFREGDDVFTIKPRSQKFARMTMPSTDGSQSSSDNSYVLYKEEFRPDYTADSVMRRESGRSMPFKREMTKLGRSANAGQLKTYTVEMLMFIDYALYKSRYEEALKTNPQIREEEALTNVRFYFGHVFNGVALRYMNIQEPDFRIQVKLVGMYVAMTPMDSKFASMAPAFDERDGVGYVHADRILDGFEAWLEENTKNKNLPANDQGTLFTGSVMWRGLNSRGQRRHIYGLADIKSVCSRLQATVNEDLGEFGSSQTAAHEMGHNLGAYHDGFTNDCDTKNQFVMASSPLQATDENFKNGYKFSRCSIASFKDTVDFLTAYNRNCLTNSARNIPELDVHNRRLPGQTMTPDEQCRMIQGPKSFYCGGAAADANICRVMPCYNPDLGRCFHNFDSRAATGTTCGNRKWCVESDCIYNDRAPAAKDYCIYGDFKGRFIDGNLTCAEVTGIPTNTWKCYQKDYQDACCVSCAKLKQNNPDTCPYGDRAEWCPNIETVSCYGSTSQNSCCKTCADRNSGVKGCEYGDRAKWCNTMFLGDCHLEENKTCCKACQERKRHNKPGCHYGDKKDWCSKESRERCYHLSDTCCETCEQWYTGINGCEYGDRILGCTLDMCSESHRLSDCCYTCRHVIGRTPRPTTTAPERTTQVVVSGGPPCRGPDMGGWCQTRLRASDCYVSLETCCASCRQWWTGVRDCEFGDKASWCDSIHPGHCRLQYNREMCCRTCASVSPGWTPERPTTTPHTTTIATTTPTPTRKPRCGGNKAEWCRDINPWDCYVVDDTCCDTCRSMLKPYAPQGCHYGDRVSWCNNVNRNRCYETDMFIYCCNKCEKARGTNADCPFGDRKLYCTQSDCADPTGRRDCCETCRAEVQTMAPPTFPPSTYKPPVDPRCPAQDPYWCYTMNSGACYDPDIRRDCCRTCPTYYNPANIGCEYGDMYSWCPNSPSYCQTNKADCCASCK